MIPAKTIEVMKQAAKQAGLFQKEKFRTEIDIQSKTGHHDLVTEVDHASQKIIVEILNSELPTIGFEPEEIGFLGEEGLHNLNKYTFIIDPLDGTANYASGFDMFGVLIGLMYENEVVAGVIYLPMKDEFYTAVKGQGAWKEASGKNTKVELVSVEDLNNCTAFAPVTVIQEISKTLNSKLRGIRMLKSYAVEIAYILDNCSQINLAFGTSIWDIAACKIIVEEAGGIYTDYYGKPLQFDMHNFHKKYPHIVCHKSILAQTLPYLSNIL